MSQVDFYNQGTRVWFPDPTKGFVPGTVLSNEEINGKIKIVFDIEGREEKHELLLTKEEMQQGKNLPHLRNPPVLEGIDDLTLLSHLHEPAVLHNVKLRYSQEQIYTYSGIVLIALNPFQRLPIYTHDIMKAYSGKRRGELEPHLFAVAEEAYRNMLKENRNQSIIVSGESGAGKTQSAKYIMRYFATVDDIDKNRSEPESEDIGVAMSEIEEAVLATNPIMEAFGNAKTTRNDNSSRFGKYIEIQFLKDPNSQRVKICGAKTRTYLLERSRLVFQPLTERNYHIFYQLCAGCPAAERKELGISTFEEYHYLNQGGEGTIPGVDDVEEFAVTQKALSAIGIPVSLQWSIFRLCAALLHIGNIEISKTRNDDSQINSSDPALEIACKLLGVSPIEFSKWIIKKQIRTRMETIVANRKSYDALVCRDSIAKFLYSKLFDWLVDMVNKNLAYEKKEKDDLSFIGVLDIYGFEHFPKNSFEQFCINYANEKLQQEFNQHVFKLEQDEYINEKIEWSFIDFNDNQPCIDMIESRFGILALLDEECRLPSGSDKSLISKLYQNFDNKESKFFKKPRFSQNEFTIVHYALDVTYQIEGFIEKNKDTVSDEQLDLLQKSTNEFIKELTQTKDDEETSPISPISPINKRMSIGFPISSTNKRASFGSGSPVSSKRMSMSIGGFKPKSNKHTLGSIFKKSLIDLMTTIRSTDAHYIRCIKPNQAKEAFEFEPMMVLSQLRACGVLETIRISCAGYPTRWTFQEFVERYFLLINSKNWNFNDPKSFSLNIVNNTIKDNDKFQVGLTKIFFRTGMLAYLEKLRSDKLKKCVVLVQKNARRFIYQRRYQEIKKSAILVQNRIRSVVAKRKLRELSEEHSAIIIQKYIRGFLAKKHYDDIKSSALLIQTYIRSYFARKALNNIRKERAAIKIQKIFRGQRENRKYIQIRKDIVFVQSCIRRHFATKEFKTLKAEAKSITYMKKLNYQLENKVFELSQSLTQKEKDNQLYEEKIKTMDSQIQIWKEKFERLDNRFKESNEQVNEGSAEQKREIAELKENRTQLEAYISQLKNENAQIVKSKNKELDELREQLQRQIEENKKLRENMKNMKPSEDSTMVNQLKREVLNLKDQLQKSIVGKLKGEGPTEGYGTEAYLLDAEERIGRPVSIGRNERGRSKSSKRRPAPSKSFISVIKSNITDTKHNILQSSQSAPSLPALQNESSVMNNKRRSALGQKIETHPNVVVPITEAVRRKSTIPAKPKEPTLTLVIPESKISDNSQSLNSAPIAQSSKNAKRKSNSQINVPVSALQRSNTTTNIRNMEEEYQLKILEDDSLEHEIIEGLIMNLRIPIPSTQAVYARKDILFPAHIIGSCMQKLLNHGLLAKLQVLSSKVMRSIQSLATRFEDDCVSCFWLSNTFELMCVLERVKLKEDGSKRMNTLYSNAQDVLNKISNDLEYLLVELYHGWMKELKKRISNMAVPAIIENQSLPNFYCNKSGGLWNKIKSAPQASYTIDQLLTFLSKISMVLRCYFMEESIAHQILCELMRILGVTAFNHLIMRKNFCTWKRGMQIQYNLSRLEEWCDMHQIPEGSIHIEPLVQAAKLLQLNKTTYHDIETIFSVCYLLNSTQIKKLLSLYYPIDFENPVSSDILRSVSQHSNSEMNNNLLLDTEDSIFNRPPIRPVDKIDTSGMPTWSDLFLIKCLLEAD
ncbi:hypothetical protein H8356DRAFT_1308897 [Neocallimastix lanati (nom. inval.)]|jgi:myosin-5|uniref:Myosin-2 n=1 Tax=Neocallimastix californiae TaxID=1754190 RepID=A0A1Y2A7E8_9FUNG|nr:hypothetical protein H8356DRAFT_1308897 [Neocallimastix sp. JGI-2020a]ORY18428.1 hypothetical protein LY90DRAFT_391684 [Neocallimastix californiae]|eukprot:ORY18428.1 hypothetical protein LY90DRAFT_391684 [Neocallimastix californiae]